MFALINRFNKPHETYGVIISVHRTSDAAASAGDRLQRRIKQFNGDTSYVPTSIVRLKKRAKSGDIVPQKWVFDEVARSSRMGFGPDPDFAVLAWEV